MSQAGTSAVQDVQEMETEVTRNKMTRDVGRVSRKEGDGQRGKKKKRKPLLLLLIQFWQQIQDFGCLKLALAFLLEGFLTTSTGDC